MSIDTVDDLLAHILGQPDMWCEKCQRFTTPYESETGQWPCCDGCWHRYDYWTEYDGLRLKDDEEIDVVRVSGRLLCECGTEAHDHPQLGRWGGTFHVLCNGAVVKT